MNSTEQEQQYAAMFAQIDAGGTLESRTALNKQELERVLQPPGPWEEKFQAMRELAGKRKRQAAAIQEQLALILRSPNKAHKPLVAPADADTSMQNFIIEINQILEQLDQAYQEFMEAQRQARERNGTFRAELQDPERVAAEKRYETLAKLLRERNNSMNNYVEEFNVISSLAEHNELRTKEYDQLIQLIKTAAESQEIPADILKLCELSAEELPITEMDSGFKRIETKTAEALTDKANVTGPVYTKSLEFVKLGLKVATISSDFSREGPAFLGRSPVQGSILLERRDHNGNAIQNLYTLPLNENLYKFLAIDGIYQEPHLRLSVSTQTNAAGITEVVLLTGQTVDGNTFQWPNG